ncbi:MAG: lamin tail domain-containing protein [Dokdonella sp.]
MTTRTFCRATLLALFFTLFGIVSAQAGGVVISQVYGGGGNSGAPYTNDFVELFNAGSTPQSLNGWSIQYTSATGTTWGSNVTVLPNISLQAGQYFLVQEASGGTAGLALPTADTVGTIGASSSKGKFILVNTTTGQTGTCPSGPAIIDTVDYGAADACEGTATAALSNTTAALRKGLGCTDTNSNVDDFTVGAPAPRNTTSPLNVCSTTGPTNPSGTGSATPATLGVGDTTLLSVTVTPGTNPVSTSITVTADLSPIGGSSTQTLSDAGGNVFTFAATIGAGTPSGAQSLPVTITDAQSRSGSATIALTVTSPPVTIMQIQGDGAASPLVGQTVTTTGNIVTAVGAKGFFMQDPVGGVPNTSSGLYVFTSTAPTVVSGDSVDVTGKVVEFSGSTELTTATVSVVSSGHTLPAAYVLDSNPPSTDPTVGICQGSINPVTNGYQARNFACLDGMLITMIDGVATGPTFGSGADGVHAGTASGFYATVASQPRPFRGPGVMYPGLGGTIPVWGGAPEILEVYYKGLGFDPTGFIFNAGAHFSVTGVIQGYQSASATYPIYEVYPASMTALDPAPAYPQAVKDSAAGTLTIGTQNMLHFFNATPDSGSIDSCTPGSKDVCPTPAQYAIRLRKMSKQVREVLKAPVVLGVQEVENYATLTDLANQISADSAGAIVYQRYTLPSNDIGGITIGLLVRSDVTVNSVTQMYKDTMTTSCSSNPPCLLNDRPPVLLDATLNGYRFAVLAIYDRSLINLGAPGKDYIGHKRTEQAVQVASIVQAWQSGGTIPGNAQQDANGNIIPGPVTIQGDANIPLVVLGDFNAYEFSDGYVDVVGLIKGTADPTQNFYWDMSGTYVAPNPTLVDSGIMADPAKRYSYNYSGYAQEIDHILLSRPAWTDFVSLSNAHGNSDVSEASGAGLDDTTAARSSDHDGQVLTIAIDRIFADGYENQP